MSGRLCKNDDVRDSKSFCEGRLAAKNGALVGTNPHPANCDANVAWTEGFDSWSDDPANGPAQGNDCCGQGLPYGGGYVAP